MATDHYKTLNVARNASDDDLKKSYHKLAIRWHPDKNSSKEAEAKFKQIREAYKVLGDPQMRKIYDQYGEKGVSEQQVVQPPSSKSVHELYRDMVADSIPVEVRKRLFREDTLSSSSSSAAGAPEAAGGSVSGGAGGGVLLKRGKDVEKPLVCGLDELYRGAAKKLRISRDDVDTAGRLRAVEEVLTIDIEPGWKKGTKVTFRQKGIVRCNQIPSDLIFVIEERPHVIFKREMHNLIVTQNVSLLEALTGCTVHLMTLDGRNLVINISSVISPSYEEVVPEEGMPIPDSTKKGDLIIRFKIEFPASLTAEQKECIKRFLPPL